LSCWNNEAALGLGEIYYGPTLALNYGVGGLEKGQDPRTPDIIVTPNEGVTYSGSATMIGDHGLAITMDLRMTIRM